MKITKTMARKVARYLKKYPDHYDQFAAGHVKLSDDLVHHSTGGLRSADHATIKLLWETSKCDQ